MSRTEGFDHVMPDASLSSLVIAHQFGGEAARAFGGALPPGAAFRALAPETAWEIPADADVLVAVPPRGKVIVPRERPAGWPGKLRWLHTTSAGVDEFPRWIFDAPLVTCGRGTNSVPIAEFVLAGILAVEKRLPESWINSAAQWRQPKGLGALQGKTLGLLGYGSIGQAIAVRAAPFGMNILAFRRSAQPGETDGAVRFMDFGQVLEASDHLVIALPLTAATEGLVGRDALARVKPGAHLVNIARGRILDQEALLAALENGRLGFATLDVTEPEPLPEGHPLYTHPRVHLSPHISWSGEGRVQAGAALFQENLRRFLAGEELLNKVDAGQGY